jgi:hypothetical protein
LRSFSFFYFTNIFMNFVFCLRHLSIILIFILSKLWSTDRRNSFSLRWFLKTLLAITDVHPQLAGLPEVWGCRWSWICSFRVDTLLFFYIHRWFPHDIAITCLVSNQLFDMKFLDSYITNWDLVKHPTIIWLTRALFALLLILFLFRFHIISKF